MLTHKDMDSSKCGFMNRFINARVRIWRPLMKNYIGLIARDPLCMNLESKESCDKTQQTESHARIPQNVQCENTEDFVNLKQLLGQKTTFQQTNPS